jgi:hypothetical protein
MKPARRLEKDGGFFCGVDILAIFSPQTVKRAFYEHCRQ